jgi:hypothetical protein
MYIFTRKLVIRKTNIFLKDIRRLFIDTNTLISVKISSTSREKKTYFTILQLVTMV